MRDCRTEPVLYQGLILTWAGYEEIQGGVERIVPSHCSHHVCPAGYAGVQCDQMVQDKVLALLYNLHLIIFLISD